MISSYLCRLRQKINQKNEVNDNLDYPESVASSFSSLDFISCIQKSLISSKFLRNNKSYKLFFNNKKLKKHKLKMTYTCKSKMEPL
mmetsp:Transcript_37678/g.87769  ORF Transcript_37678/g.87769 Transcript_37678/m.87769 type:complete len:86 (-) Transcript_37678:1-258(-)